MRDGYADPQMARIRALGEKWVRGLGFGTWKVTHSYSRDGTINVRGKADADAVFVVTVDWSYLTIYIEVNLAKIREMDDQELERCYLHEFGHAYLAFVQQSPKGKARHLALEHAATMIGNALQWSRKWGAHDERRQRKQKKRERRAKAQAQEHSREMVP